jgi:hypothetical protein
MSDSSKFVPNSFQVPNLYVDSLFQLLDGEEISILMFACRRIFGWQKRTDRISSGQFAEGCGLHIDTVTDRLKSLAKYRILIRVSENNPRLNEGPEWGLQLDENAVDWDGLEARKAEKEQKNQKRIEAARAKMAQKKAENAADNQPKDDQIPPADNTPPADNHPPSHEPPTPTLSDKATPYPVGQGTQKPIKPNIKSNISADAQNAPEPKKPKPAPPPSWGADWQMAAGGPVVLPEAEEQAEIDLLNALNLFHEPEKPFVQAFHEGTGILPVQADLSFWRKTISYLRAKGVTPQDLVEAARQASKDNMTVASPKSLEKYAIDINSKARRISSSNYLQDLIQAGYSTEGAAL